MPERSFRGKVAGILIAIPLTAVVSFAAIVDSNHAFISGDPLEMGLARDVRRALVTLPDFGVFDDLEFKMDGDTVTIYGKATRPALKEAADYAVHQIEGLTLVTDQIEVLPPSPVDEQIRLAEYKAIYEGPAMSNKYEYRAVLPIHIIVKNGNVTLEGVVASQADANLIGTRASSVPTVSSVKNNLQVATS